MKKPPASHPTTTQTCPDCDGIMPPEAVQIGDWELDTAQARPVNRRAISMRCPHCGARHHRVESQPVNALIF